MGEFCQNFRTKFSSNFFNIEKSVSPLFNNILPEGLLNAFAISFLNDKKTKIIIEYE